MLHIWVIPLVVVLVIGLVGAYIAVKYRGGSGVRTSGRCLVDETGPEDDPPPPD